MSESKWTIKQLDPSVVTDLDQYKIPALRDGGFRLFDLNKARTSKSSAARKSFVFSDAVVQVKDSNQFA